MQVNVIIHNDRPYGFEIAYDMHKLNKQLFINLSYTCVSDLYYSAKTTHIQPAHTISNALLPACQIAGETSTEKGQETCSML